MSDKKISQLPALITQALTDIYEVSANGTLSSKESRQQMLNYFKANSFVAANTFYVDPNGDNSNSGAILAPYADPFAASNAITGSVSNPKLVVVNSGIYTTSNFKIKPNISLIGGSSQTTLDDNGTITLDSSWSSAAAFSYACFRGFDWNGGWNLDFNAAGFSTGVLFYENCYLETVSITGSVAAIIFTGGSVGTLNLISTSATFNGADVEASVTIASGSASGNKTNEFIACNFNSSSNITVSGASGKVQTLIIKSSPIRGTLTLDGTFVTLRIDATSIPQGGITYINGATDSQVNLMTVANSVYASNTRSNYTPTSATIEGNLAGIDTALGAQPAQNVNPNIIIGGNFDTNPFQRGALFNPASNNTFVADRFKWVFSGGGQVEWLQNNSNVPSSSLAGFKITNALQMIVQIADASIGASDIYRLSYGVEGPDWERIAGITSTLSFLVCATISGTYCVAVSNSAGTRVFISEYTINASNTWQKITITIPDTASTGTWDYTVGGLGAKITWCLAGGSNFQGSTGWNTVASDKFCTSNQVNTLSAGSNDFQLTNIKLEPGSTATPYPQELTKDILARCQRYYHKSYSQGVSPGAVSTAGMISNLSSATTGALGKDTRFKVDMSYTPTVQSYDGAGTAGKVFRGADGNNATIDFQGTSGVRIYSATGASAATFQCQYTADAELI